jgi:hypothetical protein
MRKIARRSDAPGAVQLVEESVNLVRSAPASAWAIYLAGAVPWVLGLGNFWATASWFSPRPAELLWRALGLVALYLWLKVAQAEFCRRLRARRMGAEAEPWSWRGLARVAARQARVQGWAAPLMPIASVLTIPLAATWMYFENATALAGTRDPEGETLERRARREALRWQGPAHLALLLFSGLWFCVWINVASAFYVLPWLARTLFGLENMFGLSGWSAFNSTFLALATVLTWLAVDPLVKAYHVLRTFYGEARLTGEDLRLEMRRPGRGGAAVRAALVLLACALAAGVSGDLRAEESGTATPAQVDAALDEALRDRDFRWSLQPLPSAEGAEQEDGLIKGFVRQGVEMLAQMVRDVRDWMKRVGEWIDGLFSKKDKPKRERVARESSGDFGGIAKVLLYGLLALCVGALLWVLWLGWNQRRPPPSVLAPLAAAPLPPDLNDEKLEASRLPPDEWLELARAQMARGEWRLALRALYLGALARLGAEGLVTLARAKTNLDYERELARRAAGRADVVSGFRAKRLSFERVWYGRDVAEEALVRAWFYDLERARERAGEGGA